MIDSRDQHEERGAARMFAWMLVLIVCAFVVAFFTLLPACGLQDIGGGAGLDIPGLGEVFQCDIAAPTPSGLEEWCTKESREELEDDLGATCVATPRHAGPCIYRCPSATGCNAYSGCWCPG